MNYTFFNQGTVTTFNPEKKTTGRDGSSISLLEFHQQLVAESGRKDVYILNQKGKEVPCPSLDRSHWFVP